MLYVAHEAAGTVQALPRTGEATFAPLGGAVDAGDFVCHVAVAPTGDSVIAVLGRRPRRADDVGCRRAVPPVIAAATSDPYGAEAETAEFTGRSTCPHVSTRAGARI